MSAGGRKISRRGGLSIPLEDVHGDFASDFLHLASAVGAQTPVHEATTQIHFGTYLGRFGLYHCLRIPHLWDHLDR